MAAVEVDFYAAKAYHGNVGTAPLVEDISCVSVAGLLRQAGLAKGQCTVLLGCPPCQSFSELRRGTPTTEADRSRDSLPDEMVRIVRGVMPRHLAMENVPGLTEGRRRQTFDSLVEQLEGLGYRTKWDILDAADYGVPQHRRRLVLIASRVAAPRLPRPTHGDPGSLLTASNGLQRWHTVRDAIGDLRPLNPGEADPEDLYHRARQHSDLNLRRLRALKEGQGREQFPEDLRLECHRNHAGHRDVYGRMWWDRPAPTLTSGCTNITRGRFAHPKQDRAITLREALRLQSFPDETVLWGVEGQMALQVGNAVPPLLGEHLAEVILEMERDTTTRANPLCPAVAL